MATISPAQTCREVVRDASGRVVQTVEHQKSSGGVERAVTRDASGSVTGTSRDASSRVTGSSTGSRNCP
ncbi:MAG: hypothetical protein WEB53_07425 [Akkermansiaceae bacterium]